MTSSIKFGSNKINFNLDYSNRKTLGITVKPDLSVLVKAPINTSVDIIKTKLYKKAPWIIKQQSFFLTFHPKTPTRKFIGGETHLYLGRQYRLKIIKGKEESVKLKNGFIEVHTLNKLKAKKLVTHWYLERARIKLNSIAKSVIAKFKVYNVEPSSIVFRSMPTRWGSCTPKGKIILNPELINAPKGCIEYVIIHELCHLIYHDHTKKFIELQAKQMPDWEKWKMKLEKLLA